MDLVRVEDDDASRIAEAAFAAILKRLDAAERYADGIGVVAVRLEKFSMQARLDALDAIDGRRNPNAVARRAAQSFKIDRSAVR